ncbi:alpha/beta hydrolase family protein [Roseivirga misakiensis]|uniref:Dipeptidyl aminopeptidase n=1 Tax=Roseivirga misakiensis TaxID=1563681 RepID=A0A1E5SZH7_9BACT|nr:prolyl oligopeptidase family serine peptidase [Roseivirga misakiensis]OEK04530.1 dipeptidyl aminopeptidase [Roseivirga misakiensis]
MKKLVLTTIVLFLLINLSFAQKTAFTVEDAIRVKSLGSQTLSNDGTLLAGIISDGKARFGTDHFRFRDPSYLNLRAGRLVIINTNSGAKNEVFKEDVRVTSLTWDEDGKNLFFLQQQEDKLVLAYYEVKSKRTKYVKVKDSRILTSNSGINVMPNGSDIVLAVRKVGWFEKAMAEYKEATEGPIVVYDGNDDFLKWDRIGLTGSLTEIVKINVKSGNVEDLLPESSYGGISISREGKFLSYPENFRTKTSYKRNDGTEYKLSFLKLTEKDAAPEVIYGKSDKRRRFWWDEDERNFAWVDSGNVYVDKLSTFGTIEPLNITKGKAFEDEKKEKPVKFSVVRWNPSGNKLLLSSKKGWWTINSNGKNLKMIYELPQTDEEKKVAPNRNVVKWSNNGKYLYVSYSEKDRWQRGIQRFNIDSGKFESLVVNENLYSSWRFARDSDKVVYSKSDGDRPNNVFTNTLDFKSETQLTDLNPWVADKKWTYSELISYRDADGEELKGILYYPVDYDPNKKYPLVLEVYETFFNNGYRSSMNLLANQGYFGLRPSVDLEQGYPGEAWLKGATSAINLLVENGQVDNDKVGIQGTSYGGYASSLIITQTDRFAAAINISGKVNIISFLGDSPKIGTRNYAAAEVGQDRIGGSFWDEPLKYFQTSAVFFADRVKTPHLLISGEGDWNVPGTNSREMYYALRRLGKDVTWVNYMKGGHGAGWASTESDYYDQWERIFNYYDKYFFPKEEKK